MKFYAKLLCFEILLKYLADIYNVLNSINWRENQTKWKILLINDEKDNIYNNIFMWNLILDFIILTYDNIVQDSMIAIIFSLNECVIFKYNIFN